jgi:energy-converting hydrogenase Eha subunit C
MKLNAPTQTFWLIALILGGIGIVSHLIKIPNISPYSFPLLAIGFIILVIATLLKRT